jgi:hypothetical protein
VRRVFSIVLAVVLLGGVAAAIYLGRRTGDSDEGGNQARVDVRGVIGSEKSTFFADPAVDKAFARHGLRVRVDPAGSRRIAELDLAPFDFAFPGSLPSAEKIQRTRQIQRTWSPFYSPMAIATFNPVAELLQTQGLVSQQNGYLALDVPRYLAAAASGLRWDAIPGNRAYPARRNVLVTTTHPRDSNSAAMYAAVVSYVLNNENVVRDQAQLGQVQERVAKLFLDQGYLESSTEGPWESYLANGLNFSPLVWVYEAQFVGRQLAGGGPIRPDMTLVYPSPTVLSKHTLVPVTDAGDRVGRLLTEDPELQRLAARHGFRTAAFESVLSGTDVKVPAAVTDVVDAPAFEIQEAMLDLIAGRYKQ